MIGGRVYVGYGDYTNNTGPVNATSLPADDIAAASWAEHVSVASEQIDSYRDLGAGRILTPHIDPRGARGGGYAERQADGTWVDRVNRITAVGVHVFDVIEHLGDLFACGSGQAAGGAEGQAIVWTSTDDGATWSESLRDALTADFSRFYGFAVADGNLWVRGSDSGVTYVLADGAWAPSDIDLLPAGQLGGPGIPWRDGTVLPGTVRVGPNGASLYYFDGTAWTSLAGQVRGFDVGDDGALYFLVGSIVLRVPATGAVTPTPIVKVGQSGSEANASLCVLPGSTQALVGTTNSRLKLIDL